MSSINVRPLLSPSCHFLGLARPESPDYQSDDNDDYEDDVSAQRNNDVNVPKTYTAVKPPKHVNYTVTAKVADSVTLRCDLATANSKYLHVQQL